MLRIRLTRILHARAFVGAACLAIVLACDGEAPMEPDPGGPAGEPGPATQLVFDVQPTDGTAGTPLAPSVEVAFADNQGAVVTSATGAITLELENNSAGATLLGSVTVGAVDGVATFDDLAVDQAGTDYTLTASSGNLTSAASEAFAIAPGEPAQLVFETPPGDVDLDDVLAPAVEVSVQDAYGNVVPTATVDVTVSLGGNPGGATLGGATTVAAMDGVASFDDLTVDRPAPGFALVAESADLEPATSAPFAVLLAFQQLSGSITIEDLLPQEHTCGLTTGGAAYCWGANDLGQLGDGNGGSDSDVPVRVAGDQIFQSIVTGVGHTCGLTTDGDPYCWGNNQVGQLGNGNAGVNSDVPVLVVGGHTFAQLAAGSVHTCGLSTEGIAGCWGDNSVGQLGDGNGGTASSTPVPVEGGHTFASITAAGGHTCGVNTEGIAGCWGLNDFGQLGDGNAGTDSDTPVLVLGGHIFASLAAGGLHTCGITTDGDASCWGSNDSGQLGDGTGFASSTPVLVQSGQTFETLIGGGFHTCGRTAAGDAWCWGENFAGALGDGNTGVNTTTPVAVIGGHAFASLAGGTFHSCGVTTDRRAYCWGWNEFGQLGDGSLGVDRDVPAAVVSP